MTDKDGGFYSAEDADSVIDPANPKEKGEGAFYIWKKSEIESLLGETAASHFNYHYGVEPPGNVKEDPHHEFTGRNILFEAHTIPETAVTLLQHGIIMSGFILKGVKGADGFFLGPQQDAFSFGLGIGANFGGALLGQLTLVACRFPLECVAQPKANCDGS